MALAPDALVTMRIWPSPCSIIGGTTALRKWYGDSRHPATTLCRSSTVDCRKRPVTTRPENADAASMRPKRSRPAATSRSDAVGIAEVLHVGDDLDRRAGRFELLDEAGLRIADDEVVAARREDARQRRPDVEVRVGDERDARRVRHRVSVVVSHVANLVPQPWSGERLRVREPGVHPGHDRGEEVGRGRRIGVDETALVGHDVHRAVRRRRRRRRTAAGSSTGSTAPWAAIACCSGSCRQSV